MRNLHRPASRATAVLLTVSMIVPLLGCGRPQETINAAPPNAPYGSVPPPQQQQRTGMSTKQKLEVLAGAAALYYLYNKHKNSKGAGPNGQYYRSKNGQIYYRDANGNAIWVTPPAGGIQVPADEADYYRRGAQQGNWDTAP